MSVRFTTAHTTSYIAYLRPIITGLHRSRVCSRVYVTLLSRVFRSRGRYHDRNHNDEWPQFSRYKPRDDIDALAARIKPVKENAEARIFNAASREAESSSVVTKMSRYFASYRELLEEVCVYIRTVKLYSM